MTENMISPGFFPFIAYARAAGAQSYKEAQAIVAYVLDMPQIPGLGWIEEDLPIPDWALSAIFIQIDREVERINESI